MNALTRINSNTPVKFDVMNTMCTEVEARDNELAQQINDLKELNKRAVLYSDSFGRLMSDTHAMYTEDSIWFNVLCDEMKWIGTNRAVSSSSLSDGCNQMLNTSRGNVCHDRVFLNLGFNDMRMYGNKTGIDVYVANYLRYLSIYSITNKINITSTNLKGTWYSIENSRGYTMSDGKNYISSSFAYAPTDYFSYSFTGTNFAFGYLSNTTTTLNPTLKIEVDGVIVKTVEAPSMQDLSLGNNPYAIVVNGLSNTTHTVKIYNTKENAVFNINWIGTLNMSTKVYINQITKMTAEGYAVAGYGSDTVVTAINTAITNMISSFATDGITTIKSINFDSFNPAQYIGPDKVHPTMNGNIKIKDIVGSYISAN